MSPHSPPPAAATRHRAAVPRRLHPLPRRGAARLAPPPLLSNLPPPSAEPTSGAQKRSSEEIHRAPLLLSETSGALSFLVGNLPSPLFPEHQESPEGSRSQSTRSQLPTAMAEKLAPEKRHAFVHNGQKVFEWDQTLEEVNMYIELPKGVPTKLFRCTIQAGHVEAGIHGNPPYLNHDLSHPVKTDSSFWTIEDGEMHITLQKREKGKTWSSPIQGQGILDPYAADQEQKRLMLQRFQEENPGFDFSQAQFSGTCPDPRTFMGGIRSD